MKILHLFFKKKNDLKLKKNNNMSDPYNEISIIVKEARMRNKISIEQLSKISKIPTSTLFSIENNVKEIRPKYPFLRSILIKLEECLILKESTLTFLAERAHRPKRKLVKKSFIIKNFDFINSWQGSLIYLLTLLVSLIILNGYYSGSKIIEFKLIESSIKNTLPSFKD